MTQQRVRLTQAAATRFPDLAGQTGIPVARDRPGNDTDWVFIVWPDPRGAAYEPRHMAPAGRRGDRGARGRAATPRSVRPERASAVSRQGGRSMTAVQIPLPGMPWHRVRGARQGVHVRQRLRGLQRRGMGQDYRGGGTFR